MSAKPKFWLATRWLRGVTATLAVASIGCQQQMADQPSYKPLEPSEFFEDGRSARPAVAGTVARGHLRTNAARFTGRLPGAQQATPAPASAAAASVPAPNAVPPGFADDAAFVREFPIAVSESVMTHGYNRYMIYCVVCHDPLGTGRGKIIERGYTPPPSLHIDRLRNAPAGRLFAVITEGYGSMPSYAEQIPPEDRWAIVVYVRALQLSQHFPVEQLSPEMQKELAAAVATAAPETRGNMGPQERVP